MVQKNSHLVGYAESEKVREKEREGEREKRNEAKGGEANRNKIREEAKQWRQKLARY